jgi:S1-C subfamily serine protease
MTAPPGPGTSAGLRRRAVAGLVATVVGLASACVGPPGPRAEASYPVTTLAPPSTLAPPPPPAPTVPVDEPLRHARNATARVRNLTCDGLGTGSGFLLAGDRLVTNTHVVVDGTDYDAETWDGRDLDVDSTSARVPTGFDLAVLTVRGAGGPALELAPTDAAAGDVLRVLGYPLGGAFDVRTGPLLQVVTDPRLGVNGPVMVMDIGLEPGNSGGPVIDRVGRVVGVVYARRAQDGTALAMPASSLRSMLEGTAPADHPPPKRC